MKTFFNEAIKQSKKSSYKARMGAVVVHKNKVVGKGFNIAFSTGEPRNKGIHAEIAAINNTTAKFRNNSIVVVVRLNKSDELAISKPCDSCEKVMRKLGVKQVWYSTSEGWNKMSL